MPHCGTSGTMSLPCQDLPNMMGVVENSSVLVCPGPLQMLGNMVEAT